MSQTPTSERRPIFTVRELVHGYVLTNEFGNEWYDGDDRDVVRRIEELFRERVIKMRAA